MAGGRWLVTDLTALKQRANIRDIVSEHVRLRARGRVLWGCCPFHKEDTASFKVDTDRQFFHCFGCGASGDVIDFTAQINHVSKGRAIRMLAERYGVTLGPPVTRAEGQYMRGLRDQAEFWWTRRRAVALAALEAASGIFFADQTSRNEELAIAAGAYLRMLDDISPALRGRSFLALRTARDARVWEEWRSGQESREFDAALRAEYIHERLARGVRTAERDGYKDPADFILKFGATAFRRAVDEAWEVPT